eukprot:8264_1
MIVEFEWRNTYDDDDSAKTVCIDVSTNIQSYDENSWKFVQVFQIAKSTSWQKCSIQSINMVLHLDIGDLLSQIFMVVTVIVGVSKHSNYRCKVYRLFS